jgi:hypothetical protein
MKISKSNACFCVHKSPTSMSPEPDESSSHTSIVFFKAQEVSLLSRFCRQNVVFLSSCTTRPGHLTFIYLIVVIMISGEYNLWSSTLCSFLQLPLWSKYSPVPCFQTPSIYTGIDFLDIIHCPDPERGTSCISWAQLGELLPEDRGQRRVQSLKHC